jgi:citrate lyase beta subunit
MPQNPEWFYPTLYAPATLEAGKLLHKMQGQDRLVRRLVIDTEDAVSKASLPEALGNLGHILKVYEPNESTGVFVRLRNPNTAEHVLAMNGIENIRGFVIPKADPNTYPDQAAQIVARSSTFRIMPLLESAGMTDSIYRRDLLDVLQAHRSSIDCLRIGVNDLMSHLGMRRPETMTIYQTVIGKLISDIVIEFRGNGRFAIAAPLFENYGIDYTKLFQKEIEEHRANGLFGQTALHPSQLPILWGMYRVTKTDLDHADYVTSSDAEAATGNNGRLVSTNTHANWAETIKIRAELFGVR